MWLNDTIDLNYLFTFHCIIICQIWLHSYTKPSFESATNVIASKEEVQSIKILRESVFLMLSNKLFMKGD
jgi:hypothetical protein